MGEMVRKMRKPTQAYNYMDNNSKCPVCGGTGWETFYRDEEFYGGEKTEFAKPCEKCKGIMRSKDLTGVPDQFRDADIGKFNFEKYHVNMEKIKKLALSVVKDFDKWEAAGKGLYLWSETPGSGKTFLSCCIAKSIMIKHDKQMRFITAPDYIAAVGENYKRDRGERDETEVYRKCKVLVLDDIGAQKSGEWQSQEIFRLVNQRMSEGNVTFFTSNVKPQNLNLESRTIDRITRMSVVLGMPEESIRLIEAREEQDRFLKDVVGI